MLRVAVSEPVNGIVRSGISWRESLRVIHRLREEHVIRGALRKEAAEKGVIAAGGSTPSTTAGRSTRRSSHREPEKIVRAICAACRQSVKGQFFRLNQLLRRPARKLIRESISRLEIVEQWPGRLSLRVGARHELAVGPILQIPP